MREDLSVFSKCSSWSNANYGLFSSSLYLLQKEHADTFGVRGYGTRPGSMLPCNKGLARTECRFQSSKEKGRSSAGGTQQQARNVKRTLGITPDTCSLTEQPDIQLSAKMTHSNLKAQRKSFGSTVREAALLP